MRTMYRKGTINPAITSKSKRCQHRKGAPKFKDAGTFYHNYLANMDVNMRGSGVK